jgi:hypothetical protein
MKIRRQTAQFNSRMKNPAPELEFDAPFNRRSCPKQRKEYSNLRGKVPKNPTSYIGSYVPFFAALALASVLGAIANPISTGSDSDLGRKMQ